MSDFEADEGLSIRKVRFDGCSDEMFKLVRLTMKMTTL
jgi:hypothetical protein